MTREETFGARIKDLRQERGWSVRKAAKLIGVSNYRLDEIEIGRSRSTGNPTRPSRELVAKIAHAYQVPHDYLMELAGYAREYPELTDDEGLLLDLYRSLSSEQQALLVRIAKVIPNPVV